MKFWAGDFYGSIACLSKLCFMSMWPAFLSVPIPLSSPCRKVWPWNSLVAEGLTVSWSALDCKMMLSSVGIWLMNCRHATMATFVTGTQYVYHLIRLEPGAWLEMIFQARGNRPGLRCMELVLSPWHLRFPNGEHLWKGLIIPTLISWWVLSQRASRNAAWIYYWWVVSSRRHCRPTQVQKDVLKLKQMGLCDESLLPGQTPSCLPAGWVGSLQGPLLPPFQEGTQKKCSLPSPMQRSPPGPNSSQATGLHWSQEDRQK